MWVVAGPFSQREELEDSTIGIADVRLGLETNWLLQQSNIW